MYNFKLELSSEKTELELDEIASWYFDKSPGTDEMFLIAAREAFNKIQFNPYAFAKIKRNSRFRRYNLKNFLIKFITLLKIIV